MVAKPETPWMPPPQAPTEVVLASSTCMVQIDQILVQQQIELLEG